MRDRKRIEALLADDEELARRTSDVEPISTWDAKVSRSKTI